MTPLFAPVVHLEGDTARAFEHAASLGYHGPADGVVTVREKTARAVLDFERLLWAVASLPAAYFVAVAVVLVRALLQPDMSTPQIESFGYVVFGATLVLSALLWRRRRARREAVLGPLDAPPRVLRAEPDALVITTANAPERRLRYADIKTCAAAGHRFPRTRRYGLTSLTLDDGAGPIELRDDRLERPTLLHALAYRLSEAGLVTVEERPFDE